MFEYKYKLIGGRLHRGDRHHGQKVCGGDAQQFHLDSKDWGIELFRGGYGSDRKGGVWGGAVPLPNMRV